MGPSRSPSDAPTQNPVKLEPSWASCEGPHILHTFDGYDWDTIDSWKEPGEQTVWRIEVLRPGRYAVTLSYGCRPQGAGGVLEIVAGSSSIRHTVQATATAEQFARFEAGVLQLEQGEQTPTAQVVLAPDTELMRLNAIYLQRIDHD